MKSNCLIQMKIKNRNIVIRILSRLLYSVVIISILIYSSCIGIDECPGSSEYGFQIVKTRNDYSNNAYVQYCCDTIFIFYNCIIPPTVITDNYMIADIQFDAVAYLSLSIDLLCDTFTHEDLNILIPYIIDTNPFLEMYVSDCWDINVEDADLIRDIIKNNELEKYFKRVK